MAKLTRFQPGATTCGSDALGGDFAGLLATANIDPNCENLGGARTTVLNIPLADQWVTG